jgi:hypothetical protein
LVRLRNYILLKSCNLIALTGPTTLPKPYRRPQPPLASQHAFLAPRSPNLPQFSLQHTHLVVYSSTIHHPASHWIGHYGYIYIHGPISPTLVIRASTTRLTTSFPLHPRIFHHSHLIPPTPNPTPVLPLHVTYSPMQKISRSGLRRTLQLGAAATSKWISCGNQIQSD